MSHKLYFFPFIGSRHSAQIGRKCLKGSLESSRSRRQRIVRLSSKDFWKETWISSFSRGNFIPLHPSSGRCMLKLFREKTFRSLRHRAILRQWHNPIFVSSSIRKGYPFLLYPIFFLPREIKKELLRRVFGPVSSPGFIPCSIFRVKLHFTPINTFPLRSPFITVLLDSFFDFELSFNTAFSLISSLLDSLYFIWHIGV